MVDTVVLRVHNLNKYQQLIKVLDLEKNKGFKIKSASLEKNEFDRLREIGHGMRYTMEVMEFNKTGEFLAKTEYSKKVNSSHHYAFVYKIDYGRSFIEFNFSIPKYKFGSNVIMDIEHIWDKYYKYYESTQLERAVLYTKSNLIKFLRLFLAKEFVIVDIKSRDVEVNRIDFCFNQIFKCKEDALRYFNFQKKLHKKYARETNETYVYETSIMHKNERSSFKIYHKGSEYKKHDLREHLRINKEKGYEYFKTSLFQNLADRILRYEMTIRSAGLNYIFKRHLFRTKCPIFQTDYKRYLVVDRAVQRNDRISKKIGDLPDDQKAAFKKFNPYEKISKEDRATHKYVSQLLNQKPKFMLKIGSEDEEYNSRTVNRRPSCALFSEDLISICLNKFLDEVKQFQISELPEEEILALKIEKHNSFHRDKIQKADLLQFYRLWEKHGSFKEAAKASGYSRATIYRYKQRFKLMNITEKQFKPDMNLEIAKGPLDFKEYQSIMCQTSIMNGVKRFIL